MQHVVASPRVRLLHEFLTEAEAARLLALAAPLFERSPVRSVATDRRTSSTATLGGRHARDWAVAAVRERIAAFSGYDLNMLEPLQVARLGLGLGLGLVKPAALEAAPAIIKSPAAAVIKSEVAAAMASPLTLTLTLTQP